MAKLKPLSKLVGDVRENDLVQLYRTQDENGKKLRKPERTCVGYYRGYHEIYEEARFSFQPNGEKRFDVRLNGDEFGEVFGDVYHRTCDVRDHIPVSHYKIFERAKRGGEQ